MTHHDDPDLLNTVLQLLTTQGSFHLAECFRILLNEGPCSRNAVLSQAL